MSYLSTTFKRSISFFIVESCHSYQSIYSTAKHLCELEPENLCSHHTYSVASRIFAICGPSVINTKSYSISS